MKMDAFVFLNRIKFNDHQSITFIDNH